MSAQPAPLFRPRTDRALRVVVTVSVTAAVLVFTDARCPSCHSLLMSVPGETLMEVRPVPTKADRSGRGRVVQCSRDRQFFEVIEHG